MSVLLVYQLVSPRLVVWALRRGRSRVPAHPVRRPAWPRRAALTYPGHRNRKVGKQGRVDLDQIHTQDCTVKQTVPHQEKPGHVEMQRQAGLREYLGRREPDNASGAGWRLPTIR